MKKGHFGKFGGRYVPEMLIPALEELEKAYYKAKNDKLFKREFAYLLETFAGRPTPLTFAKNLTEKLGGARIYLKNEGLNHTGAHKITHCIGQALLAKRMCKKRLIAETGAGQHGLATATVAAKFGFSCTIYMGEVDVARQRPNVFLMEQLGAKVIPVSFGNKTLKDAVNAALKDWIENVKDTHYLLGSVVGPHPYPTMTADFQSIVGKEVKKQLLKEEEKLPDYIVACVGGGSNAMGFFGEFIKEKSVKLIGVEAGGKGKKTGEHASRFYGGSVGVVEGYKSYFLQDAEQVGISGLIVPDMPIEEDECEHLMQYCRKYNLKHIQVISPASTSERLIKNAKIANGFVYFTARQGITGAKDTLDQNLVRNLKKIRKHFAVPIAVGFGISKREHMRSLKPYADITIAGSAIIDVVNKSNASNLEKNVENFIRAIKLW